MNNWQTKKLGEISTISSGATPSRMKPDYYLGGTIPWVKSGELASGEVNQTEEFITHNAVDDARLKILPQGTPILAMYGATAGTAAMLNIEGTTNQAVAAIQPDIDILDPKYTFYFLKFKKSEFLRKRLGGAQPNISQKTIKSIRIPVPSLSTQQQIVEKLDAIRKLQELNQKEIEKAEELFDSFITSHLFLKSGNKVYRFDDISTFQYGLTAEGKDKGEYRFIRITDIDETGQLRSIGKKYVEADRKQVEKYLLKDGDLLVARTGATYGKFIYCEPLEPSVFASYLIKLSFKPELALPRFVWLFTRTERYWIQAKKLVTGSGQPQFNANRIKEIEIPLPPLNKQKEIVTRAEQLLIYTNGLKKEQIILKELFGSTLNKLMKPNYEN